MPSNGYLIRWYKISQLSRSTIADHSCAEPDFEKLQILFSQNFEIKEINMKHLYGYMKFSGIENSERTIEESRNGWIGESL